MYIDYLFGSCLVISARLNIIEPNALLIQLLLFQWWIWKD